ncbi:MAG: DUF2815 family protein [Anaerotignaceae bacterium]
MYQNIPTKCLTGEVRISFEHLTKPYTNTPGADPKYSCTILVPKVDANTYNDLKNALTAAYEMGVKDKWKGMRPQLRYPVIYDGDGTRPSGEPFGEECKGHWVLTASSKQMPQAVHQSNIRVQLAETDIYSGMYARVTVNFFPYDSSGNRGVGCGLGNVMKTKDGEPLSGRNNAEGDFKSIAPQQTQNAFSGSINPITGLPM